MDWSNLAAFAVTEFLLCLSPGPAVLLVVGLSMRQGLWRSQCAAAGILTTNAIYFALSAAGVASLILASATLFYMLKIGGALYLAWLGGKMVLPLVQAWWRGEKHDAPFAEASKMPRAKTAPLKLYWKGISLQAANPKNLAFFVAILPQFIDPHGPVAFQMVVLGSVSVLLELPVLLIYALSFSALAKVITERVVLWIEAIAGGILILLAGALAWEKKA